MATYENPHSAWFRLEEARFHFCKASKSVKHAVSSPRAPETRSGRVAVVVQSLDGELVLVGEAGDSSAIPVGRKHELERIRA